MYWPGITEEIRRHIKGCRICEETQRSQQKEPLISHDVPSRAWQKIGMDIFEYRGSNYLLIADYYSKFPIVRNLRNMTSETIIGILKTIFSEHGIPDIVFSDNGRQFNSAEFKDFAQKWSFEQRFSSPKHHQSNGFIEAMVKVVKSVMKRADAAGTDRHLAMLTYRATPVRTGIQSPGELLNGRKLKALLPIREYLHPSTESARECMIDQKAKQAEWYNRTARELEELRMYQQVHVQLDPESNKWGQATVIDTPNSEAPRKYLVQTPDGARYQRNRKHLRPSAPPTPQTAPPAAQQQLQTDVPPPVRRSTREHKPTRRFIEEN